MPIGTSDGDHFETDMHQMLDLPSVFDDAENKQKHLSQGGRGPLKITITPHMNAGEDQQDTPQLDEPKEVHIVRHGETIANDDNTVRGTKMPIPLNENGRAEAEKAADKLKEAGVDTIVASPLERSKETAEIIGKKLGVTPQYDPRLATWDVGEHEGKPCETSNPVLEDYAQNKQDEPVPGGESFNDFTNRSFAGIRDAVLNNKDKNLAIITHNRVEATLRGWEKTGQDNPDIDYKEAVKEETEPGVVRKTTFQPDSTILQPGPAVGVKPYPGKGPIPQANTPFAQWSKQQGETVLASLKYLLSHPEELPSTGELGTFLAPTSIFKKLLADKLEKQGLGALEIKQLTGLERDLNQSYWKQEHSDLGSYINRDPSIFKKQYALGKEVPVAKLEDILKHPGLYSVYPELRDVRVVPDLFGLEKKHPNVVGAYSRDENIIGYNPKNIKSQDHLHSTLLHEIQHWIQNHEDWPGASTVQDMPKKFLKVYEDRLKSEGEHIDTKWQLYHRLSREVESRNVQTRMNMTAEDVRNSLAESTEDVPRNKQLVIDSFKKGNVIDLSNKLSPEEHKAMQDYIKSSSLRGGKRAEITWSDEKINDFRKVMQQFDKSWNAREAEASEKFGITKASVRGLYNKFDVKYTKAQKETIKAAALRHPETGEVHEGISHGDALNAALNSKKYSEMTAYSVPWEEGFTTSEGRYVDREEAARIAGIASKENMSPASRGILEKREAEKGRKLISEDVPELKDEQLKRFYRPKR